MRSPPPGMARAAAATSSDESRPPLVNTPRGTSDISSRCTARSSVSRSSAMWSRDNVDGRLAASAALQYGRISMRSPSAINNEAGGSLWMPSNIVCGAGT